MRQLQLGLVLAFMVLGPLVACAQPPPPAWYPAADVPAPGDLSNGMPEIHNYGSGRQDFYYEWYLVDLDDEVPDLTWNVVRLGQGGPPGQFMGQYTLLFEHVQGTSGFHVVLEGYFDPGASGQSFLKFLFTDQSSGQNDDTVDNSYVGNDHNTRSMTQHGVVWWVLFHNQ